MNDPDRFAALVDGCRKHLTRLPDARLGIAPHSLRAVSPEQLSVIIPLANGGPIHIHIAEQVKEVADCLAWSGQRPVEWLLDHMAIDAAWTLVHATHMSDAEADRLAASGAVAGLTPITEANLGDGLFPAARYLQTGGMFGIGSDSNVLICAAEELRLLEYGQRLFLKSRNVLAAAGQRHTGGRLFSAALAGGARSLGQDAPELAIGRAADFVALDPNHPSLVGRSGDQLLDGWIFATSQAVDRVWRRGAIVVEQGRHRAKEPIVRRYREALRGLLES